VAYHTVIDVLKGGSCKASILLASIEAGRTIPAMRHLHGYEEMCLILAPFYHWYTVAFSLDDLFFD
jgi:hypothetical protein